MESRTLIEDVSPNGNVQAYVEQDHRVAHLYLWAGPGSEFGTRSCWIRNLEAGYDDAAQMGVDMRAGVPPMLYKRACLHPHGHEPLEEERLRIVWFEEGDAAALLEDDELLAVIPGWSSEAGLSGYARDCTERTPICWPLADAAERLAPRVQQADAYWRSWGGDSNPWTTMKPGLMAAYEAIGAHSNYYAIDGGKWPPKAMLRIPVDDGVVLVTVGVCLRPQPGVDRAAVNASALRRIELGICLSANCATEESVMRVARYISGQSGLPWERHTWLGNGHTIPCDALSNGAPTDFTAVLLLAAPVGAPRIRLPDYGGDTVSMLWLVPITERERNLAMHEGSEALVQRLTAMGRTWAHDPGKPSLTG